MEQAFVVQVIKAGQLAVDVHCGGRCDDTQTEAEDQMLVMLGKRIV